MRTRLWISVAAWASSLGLVGSPAFSQPAILDAASEILAAAALPGCPIEDPQHTLAFYRYRVDGAWHRADVAVAIPASASSVEGWLLRPETFPEWALVGQHGESNLRDLQFASDKAQGTLQLGAESWRGELSRATQGTASALRLSLLDPGRVKAAYVELTVRPATGCAERASVVTARVAWELGWMARVAGGQAKVMPAMFALKLRDDVLARALSEPAALTSLLGERIRFDDGDKRPVFTRDEGEFSPAAGDRLLRLTPMVLDSASTRAAVQTVIDRARQPGLEEVLQALEGRYAIVGYLAAVERGGAPTLVSVGGQDGLAQYGVDLKLGEEGSSLTMQLGLWQPTVSQDPPSSLTPERPPS